MLRIIYNPFVFVEEGLRPSEVGLICNTPFFSKRFLPRPLLINNYFTNSTSYIFFFLSLILLVGVTIANSRNMIDRNLMLNKFLTSKS